MQELVLLGVSGNSREVIDIVADVNQAASKPLYKCAGMLDDDISLHGKEIGGVPVLGPIVSARDFPDACFLNLIGSVSSYLQRESITKATGVPPERFVTVIHPLASVSRSAQVGRGTVIFPHVFIGSYTKVGNHVLVLPGSVVNHDVTIGDYTCVTSCVSISGKVKIGNLCYLGTNCTLKGSIRIGNRSLIGMGSVVLKGIPAGCVYVGNPARFLRSSGELCGFSRKEVRDESSLCRHTS